MKDKVFGKFVSKFTNKIDYNSYAASDDFDDSADTSTLDEQTLDDLCSAPLPPLPSCAYGCPEPPEIELIERPTYTPEVEIQSRQTTENKIQPRFITSRDVATILGVTQATVNIMCKRGELPHTRIGHLNRFEPDKINAWLSKNTVN